MDPLEDRLRRVENKVEAVAALVAMVLVGVGSVLLGSTLAETWDLSDGWAYGISSIGSVAALVAIWNTVSERGL
jgi:hypothetical protein